MSYNKQFTDDQWTLLNQTRNLLLQAQSELHDVDIDSVEIINLRRSIIEIADTIVSMLDRAMPAKAHLYASG